MKRISHRPQNALQVLPANEVQTWLIVFLLIYSILEMLSANGTNKTIISNHCDLVNLFKSTTLNLGKCFILLNSDEGCIVPLRTNGVSVCLEGPLWRICSALMKEIILPNTAVQSLQYNNIFLLSLQLYLELTIGISSSLLGEQDDS